MLILVSSLWVREAASTSCCSYHMYILLQEWSCCCTPELASRAQGPAAAQAARARPLEAKCERAAAEWEVSKTAVYDMRESTLQQQVTPLACCSLAFPSLLCLAFVFGL